MKSFFTSDLHLRHKNIIKLCNRPFNTIEEHDEHIFNSINGRVQKEDKIYILGDIGWYKNINELREDLKRINGQKYIVWGNHDNPQWLLQLKREGVIADAKETMMVQINGQDIFLSHFPQREWKGYYRDAIALYGHCHNNLEDYEYSTDIGVDAKGYRPLVFGEIMAHFDEDIVSKVTDTDRLINKFFPDLSTNYFVNYCMNDEDIRRTIERKLLEGNNGVDNL